MPDLPVLVALGLGVALVAKRADPRPGFKFNESVRRPLRAARAEVPRVIVRRFSVDGFQLVAEVNQPVNPGGAVSGAHAAGRTGGGYSKHGDSRKFYMVQNESFAAIIATERDRPGFPPCHVNPTFNTLRVSGKYPEAQQHRADVIFGYVLICWRYRQATSNDGPSMSLSPRSRITF